MSDQLNQRAYPIRPQRRLRDFSTNGLTPESHAELLAAIQVEYDQELMVEVRWRREHERRSPRAPTRARVPSSSQRISQISP